MKGVIPLTNINALITNVTNRTQPADTLHLTARAKLQNVQIKEFVYSESYADSLSYFRASCNISPGDFKELSNITVPLASIAIDRGHSNNLHANWAGNKYAAIGEMNFPYNDLALHILNKQDSSHKSLGLKLENKLANEVIINKNNKHTSVIFFERNAEKQVFNYWIKSTLQGV
ncbi:MAG: hypothetical protein H7259_00830, partial [Cytophagales bacterium]|nr:hypothetical protein [Cytophaga sp.]